MSGAGEQAGLSLAPHLLSPFRLGELMLPNRLVMLAHGTSMLEDGAPTDDDLAYYGRRAANGPGLIVTGAAVVHENSTPRGGKLVQPYRDEVLGALERRARMLRRHGAVVVGQILHLGRETIGMEVDYVPVAPSPIRSPRDPCPPQALDQAQIAEIIAAFARSAANLERTEHQGVEIHAAHGYLIGQFLSPATNLRSDAYGGDADRRLRFLREVITAIRSAVGARFLVGVRLSGEEQIADGLAIADSVAISERLASDGGVSYLSVTAGTRTAYVKDASQPEGIAIEAAATLRSASGLPTIVGQRILRPEMAEQAIAEGKVDLVGMARALIADPDWLAKVREGIPHRIRPCIGINQDCRAFAPHLHCAVNPSAGRERQAAFDQQGRAEISRDVVVVGAGPAGLEAATTAARRGHRVRLYEAANMTGGQFRAAAAMPARSDLARLIDFYEAEIEASGVTLSLSSPIDDVAALLCDVLVIAMGARAAPLPEEYRNQPLLRCADLISDGVPSPFGSAIATLVDDGTGFWWTYGTAEMLVRAGWRLRIVTPSATIAGAIPAESIGPLLQRLAPGRPEYRPLARLLSARLGYVTIAGVAGDEAIELSSDLTVVQSGRIPAPTPHMASHSVTHRIGDCLTPRRLSHAIAEGRRVGVAI